MDFVNIMAYSAFFILGLLCFISALKNADWFMDSRKARFLANFMGRAKARIFYMVFGLAMAVFGTAGIMSALL